MKSSSKDKGCARSPSSRGECRRMGGEMREEDGKGVAAESLSTNLGLERGRRCRLPESVGIYILVE